MDACNPVLLMRSFGLTKAPPLRDIDIVGWQQGHLALLALDHAQKWRSELLIQNQCSQSEKMISLVCQQIVLVFFFFFQSRYNTGLKIYTVFSSFPS